HVIIDVEHWPDMTPEMSKVFLVLIKQRTEQGLLTLLLNASIYHSEHDRIFPRFTPAVWLEHPFIAEARNAGAAIQSALRIGEAYTAMLFLAGPAPDNNTKNSGGVVSNKNVSVPENSTRNSTLILHYVPHPEALEHALFSLSPDSHISLRGLPGGVVPGRYI